MENTLLSFLRSSPHSHRAITFGLASFGVAVFSLSGLPLPFLFGPMALCLVGALAHLPMKGFGIVSTFARTILGVAVGASITPEVIGELPRMALSVALIPLFIGVIALVGVPFFRKFWGFDAPTAYYAAMPGGLQDMVIFGAEAGGDTRALSLIHATRVLIIVTLAPIILTQFYGTSLSNPIGTSATNIPLHELALMLVASIAGWKIAARVGLFGASILGPMILAAIFSMTDLIHSRPPAEAILGAQFFLGCAIGIHFLGVTWRELTRIVAAGVAYVVVLAVLAAIFAGVVSLIGLGQPVEAFLAFAPGGQAEMTVLAIVTGADMGYVITHHLTRIIIVIIGAPRRRAPSAPLMR